MHIAGEALVKRRADSVEEVLVQERCFHTGRALACRKGARCLYEQQRTLSAGEVSQAT